MEYRRGREGLDTILSEGIDGVQEREGGTRYNPYLGYRWSIRRGREEESTERENEFIYLEVGG